MVGGWVSKKERVKEGRERERERERDDEKGEREREREFLISPSV